MVWKLAFRNIFRSKVRSLITLSAIAFGCAALILAAGFIEDSVTQMQENYVRSFIGHLRIARKGYFEKSLVDPFSFMISDASQVIEKVRSIPGIRHVAARLEFSGLLSTGENTIPFVAQAVEPEIERRESLNFRLLEGENLKDSDTTQVILGRGLAEALTAHTAEGVTLIVNTPRGGINALDLTIKGVFHTISKEFDDHALRVVLATGQRLLRINDVQTLTLFLSNTSETRRVRDHLLRLFQEEHLDLDVKAWYELPEADFVVKITPFYRRLFNVLRLIILSMVILSIVNTMNMSVLERVGEIGTLSAMGTRRWAIVHLFLAEGLLLGILGAAGGLVGGILAARVISWIGIPMPTAPGTTMTWIAGIRVTPATCSSACLLVIVCTVASAFFPALKASRLEVAEALRHNV